MSPDHIDDVVDAVADGEPVDWNAFADAAPDTTRRLAHLRTIASLANGPTAGSTQPGFAFVTRVVLAVAVLQVAAALIGAALLDRFDLLNLLRDAAVLVYGASGLALLLFSADARPALLGAVFVATAAAFAQRMLGQLLDVTGTTGLLAREMVVGVRPECFLPVFVWRLVRVFPAVRRFGRADRLAGAAQQIAGFLGLVLIVVNMWAVASGTRSGLVWWLAKANQDGQRFAAVLFAALLPAFPLMVARAREAVPSERRRVTWFVWAFVLSCSPTLCEVVLEATSPTWAAMMRQPASSRRVVASVLLPLLFTPAVTIYAVTVREVAGMRTIVRQAVRYLFATATLALATAVPFGILAVYVFTHRHDRVSDILAGPHGRWLVGVGMGGCTLLGLRRFLQRQIDRWLTGWSAERSAVLAELGTTLSHARTAGEIADAVGSAGASGMRADISLLVARSGSSEYWDAGLRMSALPFESALAALVTGEEGGPVVVGVHSRNTLFALLPPRDRAWIVENSVEAIYPLPRSHGRAKSSGFLAVGARRDALLMTAADARFLATVASSCAIALRNVAADSSESVAPGAEADSDLALECAACGAIHEATVRPPICACSAPLRRGALPRRLRKFVLERRLGAGGMGVVYLATDTVLQREVAIKTLLSARGRAEQDEFEREARLMARLSHQNLATIFDVDFWRGTPVLVQEFMSGGTLQDRLRHDAVRLRREWPEIGVALCDGLEYMHASGVLHRDIKPSNIGFATASRPKLLDFGIARPLVRPRMDGSPAGADGTPQTQPAGTLAYLSPEALAGDPLDVTFDLWSLCVVLFETATGVHPFWNGRDTRASIGRAEITPRAEQALRVLPAAAFFRAAFDMDLCRRPASAAQLRESLLPLAGSAPRAGAD